MTETGRKSYLYTYI